MSQRIDLDHGRFRQIIRGKIKQNLRKYISQGEMIGRKGKDTRLDPDARRSIIPRFKFRRQAAAVAPGRARASRAIAVGQ